MTEPSSVAESTGVPWHAWLIPLVAGSVSWLVISAWTAESEAWDAGGPYWMASFFLAFMLGIFVPTKRSLAGLPGVLLGVGQFIALLLTAKEFTFVILGLFIFVFACVFYGAAAFVGTALRRRFWNHL